MICVNELTSLKSTNAIALETVTRVIAPFAPHIAEEFWHRLGNQDSVVDAEWPKHNEDYLKEDNVNYVVSFNGKARFNIQVPAGTDKAEVEKLALGNPNAERWLEGKTPKKIIVVPNKIVNIVI